MTGLIFLPESLLNEHSPPTLLGLSSIGPEGVFSGLFSPDVFPPFPVF